MADTPEGSRRIVEQAARRAEEILRARWSDMEVLAAALLERGSLNETEVDALFSPGPLSGPNCD